MPPSRQWPEALQIVDLPADLAAREATVGADRTLRVIWSGGHRSDYAEPGLPPMIWGGKPAPRRREVTLWGREIGNDLPVGD